MCVCACMYVDGGQKKTLGIFLNSSSLLKPVCVCVCVNSVFPWTLHSLSGLWPPGIGLSLSAYSRLSEPPTTPTFFRLAWWTLSWQIHFHRLIFFLDFMMWRKDVGVHQLQWRQNSLFSFFLCFTFTERERGGEGVLNVGVRGQLGRNHFSPSTVWVQRLKLKSEVVVSTHIGWTFFPF